jgi:hypothetical protein
MDFRPSSHEPILWAPKVRQVKIWQIYQNDARGTVDEDLVADVGYRLLQRCRSIQLATNRCVECPRCGTEFKIQEIEPWRLLPGPHACPKPGCGWETTAEEWHASWRHRDLLGLAAEAAFETYLQDYPQAVTVQERMLCIDQLIHAFHISLRDGKAGRSFANNLIEGSHQQVVDFLDRLSGIPGGVDKELWQAEVGKMFALRRGLD